MARTGVWIQVLTSELGFMPYTCMITHTHARTHRHVFLQFQDAHTSNKAEKDPWSLWGSLNLLSSDSIGPTD